MKYKTQKTKYKDKNNPNYKDGYKTLIIWEHELKDTDKLKDKILKFNKER